MTLKKLGTSDVEAYKEFRHYAFQESPFSFSESAEDERNLSHDQILGFMGNNAEHFTVGAFDSQKKMIAIATFKRDQRVKGRHKSYIHTMYVSPAARGQKCASRILEFLIQESKTMQGLEQIHLWVLNTETSVAKRLYSKAGFVSQGTLVKDDLKIQGQYVDAEYMTLNLLI